jgi:hypothetical protein
MTRLRIHPSALTRELEAESVILHLDSGAYYGLNQVGTRVWQLLSEHGDVDLVKAAILSEYDVDPAQLTSDLHDLVAALLDKHLLTEEPD